MRYYKTTIDLVDKKSDEMGIIAGEETVPCVIDLDGIVKVSPNERDNGNPATDVAFKGGHCVCINEEFEHFINNVMKLRFDNG